MTKLLLASVATLAAVTVSVSAQAPAKPAAGGVTFAKDIAPILQRSCQNCHRPGSIAPMPLINYEDARPWAKAIKQKTSLREMPPWYIEKNIGIHQYKNDVSLSEDEIAMLGRWADSGAARGNQVDAPPARIFADAGSWSIGEPDLVVVLPDVKMKAVSPDWWGDAGSAPIGLTEDRYVAAIQVREVNDARAKAGPSTVGGLFVFHHGIMSVTGPGGQADFGGGWPVHEVGRNAEVFNPDAGKLVKAGSTLGFPNVHLHANGKETAAHLEVGLKLHPKGYTPTIRERIFTIGTGNIDIRPMELDQKVETFTTLQQPTKITVFEPHMHAAGVRMCLDAVWGSKIETLSCAGYDHNWVRAYQYADAATPLLPKGTILRLTGYYDNTPANRNVVDPRNWSGLGHRSIDNMNILIMQAVNLTDEQFQKEMQARRETLKLPEGQAAPGCPLCGFSELPAARRTAPGGQPQGDRQ